MSTTAVIGTISIYVNDGEGQQDILSILNATLTYEREMRPALHPDTYGWEYFIPGNSDWRAEGSVLQLIDTVSLDREAYLQKIEQFCLNKTQLDIIFSAPTGTVYSGEGYIDSFQLGGAHEEGYAGSFSIQGTGDLSFYEVSDLATVFVGEDDDHFYTLSWDFGTETDTGLDLTTEAIIDIDVYQATQRVYGLGTSGTVYSWAIDGTDLQTVVATGYSDLTTISIDQVNGRIWVSKHQAALFNERTYVYTLAGAAVTNFENRYTSAILDAGFHANGTTGYYFMHRASSELYRMNMSTGATDHLQDYSGLNRRGSCMDEIANVIYNVVGSALIQFNPVTVNNPSAATQIGAGINTNNADSVDFLHSSPGTIVGCGGQKIWKFVLGGGGYTADVSTANARCLCTLKP